MEGLSELALFAGGGGGILGGSLLGWRIRCAVELDARRRAILLARQRDGSFDPFPTWDDVNTFDGRPWRGRIAVTTGGFPCPESSRRNRRRTGISKLWAQQARIIGEVRSPFAFVENVPGLLDDGNLGHVLGDLAQLGYHARWCVLSSRDLGAPDQRDRVWILAADPDRVGPSWVHGERVEARQPRRVGGHALHTRWAEDKIPQPCLCGVGSGRAQRVDRIEALGNAQAPLVAAAAWRLLGGPICYE